MQAIQSYIYEIGRRDTLFVLIGGGSAQDEMKTMAEELNLFPFVKFTGRVSDHDLCRYLSTADICLDPDPFTEWANQSTMNKIMEYMAFGKPIVAFDLKENRVSAQEAAVYANHNDTSEFALNISGLLNDEVKRNRMKEIGQRRIRNELAWDFSKPNLLRAYRSLNSAGKINQQ